MRKSGLFILFLLFAACPARAENGEAPETVYLDPVEVSAPKDTTERITQTEMERKTAATLWDALRGTPGVYRGQSTGRGEGTLQIRGSTRYQVAMYVDGVPTATSYRNEWDYNNILTYDLESIEVSKGYSSPLLQNAGGLAGVVNVRTARPQKEFEFKVKYLNDFDRDMKDQGRLFGVSMGTKQDWFYLQGAFMYSKQDYYKLPTGFDSGVYENGGKRENSDYRNKRINIIGGITPGENIDVMFGYVRQRFEKGQPPDAAKYESASVPFQRFWRWPSYETDRYYVNAKIGVTDHLEFKLIGYYDEHLDASDDYDSAFHGIVASSRHQEYDQYTAGAQVVASYAFNDANKLAVSAGYRRQSHKERRYPNTYGVDWMLWEHNQEDYYDFGAEYTLKPLDKLTLVFGASYTRLEPKVSEYRHSSTYAWGDRDDVTSNSKNLFDYQVGAFYDITDNHEVFATFAHKSRIGSMRERFATNRNSGALNNPDLDPEEAFHYEIGYRGVIDQWLKLNASVYYSDVKDKIVNVGGRNDPKYRNLDNADIYGLEIGAEAFISQYLSIGATAGFMHWDTNAENRSEENLTDAPKAIGNVYAVISPLDRLAIIPELSMTSSFYNDTDPDAANKKTPGFATFNLKVTYDVLDTLTFEAGIKNLFDKDYYYDYYYPESGRSMFAGVTYRF